ncbi:MAG: hypothetical protein IPK15_02355 [Verrucomicrobia bacterium]|nr:hypothetical protein [Verrucomicrobiota bacterium]
MKTLLLPLLLAAVVLPKAAAQGTAFTFQGRLNDGAGPATGNYDLRFTLHDTLAGGSQIGSPLTNAPVGVTNGLFTVRLDFGPTAFTGASRWIQVSVRTNGSAAAHTLLAPRQPVTAAPYSVLAGNISGNLPRRSALREHSEAQRQPDLLGQHQLHGRGQHGPRHRHPVGRQAGSRRHTASE